MDVEVKKVASESLSLSLYPYQQFSLFCHSSPFTLREQHRITTLKEPYQELSMILHKNSTNNFLLLSKTFSPKTFRSRIDFLAKPYSNSIMTHSSPTKNHEPRLTLPMRATMIQSTHLTSWTKKGKKKSRVLLTYKLGHLDRVQCRCNELAHLRSLLSAPHSVGQLPEDPCMI